MTSPSGRERWEATRARCRRGPGRQRRRRCGAPPTRDHSGAKSAERREENAAPRGASEFDAVMARHRQSASSPRAMLSRAPAIELRDAPPTRPSGAAPSPLTRSGAPSSRSMGSPVGAPTGSLALSDARPGRHVRKPCRRRAPTRLTLQEVFCRVRVSPICPAK